MGDKVIGADNQQGRLYINYGEPSETIRQTPFTRGEILAYLSGALHDASRNKRTRIRFVQKYPEWLVTIKELLTHLGSNSWMYREGKRRSLFALETTCKELDFKFNPLQLKNEGEQRMYLRGFFDAEGGIPRNDKRFYIQLTQKDRNKIISIKKILNSVGIKSGKIHNPSKLVDPNYWRVFILTSHHKMFADLIGSWHPVKQRIFEERMKI